MDSIDFASLVPFVLITIFTPGPANIAITTMAVNFGIKRTMGFMYGVSAGFISINLLAGFFSNLLLKTIPAFESSMRWIGAGYILYLAYHILKSEYSFRKKDHQQEKTFFTFKHGLLLQFLNPKVFIFILTLYTAFIYSIIIIPKYLIIVTSILALLGFCSNFLWASFGAVISHFLHQEKVRKPLNLFLALLLVYTAIKLTGILQT